MFDGPEPLVDLALRFLQISGGCEETNSLYRGFGTTAGATTPISAAYVVDGKAYLLPTRNLPISHPRPLP